VALSAYEDRRTVLEMLRAGVVGYVVKGTSADEILRTVRRSLRGQGSLSVEVTADVIHELVALLDHSEALSRELQELDRTKSELIQIVSHELFTPMTTIQGFAMLVSEQGEALKVDEVRDLADGVMRASDRLKRLVGNLEAAARLDRAGVEVATRPMTARDLVFRVLSEFPRFRERVVTVDGLEEPEVRLWADLELGARALIVVVENALAFSGDDGMVEISVQPIEGDVRMTVSDRGPGVPQVLRDRIFDAFTQTDGSITRSHEGLGIGLFLARRIMRAHGGDLTYAPRPGGGSSFTLSFPGFGVPGVEAREV
jgi:signal transduction histidine kinase